jgi:hypothetical protein
VQNPGHTFAIEGPFPAASASRQADLARRTPTHPWAPKISGELRDVARQLKISPHEAAAYHRLGALPL